MSEKESFDWESREYSRCEARGRIQEKTVYKPCPHENIRDCTEYIVRNGGYGAPSHNMPRDHCIFRMHGFEQHVKTRLLIEGNIDFMSGSGKMRLSINISVKDDEEEYLEELLEEMKKAKELMKDRLDHLKRKASGVEGGDDGIG